MWLREATREATREAKAQQEGSREGIPGSWSGSVELTLKAQILDRTHVSGDPSSKATPLCCETAETLQAGLPCVQCPLPAPTAPCLVLRPAWAVAVDTADTREQGQAGDPRGTKQGRERACGNITASGHCLLVDTYPSNIPAFQKNTILERNELELFVVIGGRSEKPFRIILHLLTLQNTLLTIANGPQKKG